MGSIETVIIYCLQCKAELGSFKNSWNGIGTTYFSPVYPPISYIDGFRPTGNVHQAAASSRIENSFLEDLACKKCSILLGLRCDRAPEGHLLKKNQLVLKFATMSLVSELTGKEVEPLMLKTFPLAVPGMKKPPGFQRAATVQPSLPQSPVLLDRHIRRQSVMPSTNGTPPSLPEVESQKDLARFRTWAKNAITGQQKDIDRIQGTVSRIEKDMSSFKDFMQEVRIELATSGQSRHLLNEGQAAIREDMNSLRKQVHTSEQRVALSLEEASQTSKTAWEGVARDVLKVSRKVSEVDSLKDELHNLTTRLQNLENLMGDGPQISQESNEINDVKGDLQYLKIRIESLESGSRGALVSAGGYEVASPEAEHHSTGGAEEPHRRISDTVPGMLSMLARPEAHGTALESTRDASLILRTGSVRWSYTGPQSLRSVRSACVAFGMTRMTRANQPIPRAIEMLEKYVNESQQQNTPNGRVYGMAAPIQVTAAQKRGTPKRPHEEVEALFDEEHSQFAHPKRIRKISAGSAKRNAVAIETSETPDPLQDLPSPPQNSAKIVPPVHNSSPILGDYDNHGEYIYAKDDVDHGYQPALKPKPKDTSKRPVGRRKRVSLTTATPNTAPKRPSRRRKSSLSTAALKNTSNKENETEAPSQTEGPEAADDTILPSIEKDDGFQVRIPPAPPTFEPRTRAFRATAATPATTRQAKPFKCGVCGKQWKNLDGLRYHKRRVLECEYAGDDEAPTFELKCKSCGKKYLSSQGLGYHLQNSATCSSNWDDAMEMTSVAPGKSEEDKTRMIELAAREKLVKETLARELECC